MNLLKVSTLTILLSAFTFTQAPHATAITAPPLETQVKQLAQWFTGLFDNSQQVETNASVPLITLSSCSVELTDNSSITATENIYLEQKSINRYRLYSFSQGDSAVNLSIRAFDTSYSVSGLCNQPEADHLIDASKVLSTSCNLELNWQPSYYIGNNAPNGCPTISGGKVVSSVTVTQNTIDSLDQIFSASGNLVYGTPIEFRRVASIPEPDFILGMLGFAIWGTSQIFLGKYKSLHKVKASV